MNDQNTNKRIRQLENILIKFNVLANELHDIVTQSEIALAAGKSRQTIQARATRYSDKRKAGK